MMDIVPSVMANSNTSGRRLLRTASGFGDAPPLQLLSTMLLQMLQVRHCNVLSIVFQEFIRKP